MRRIKIVFESDKDGETKRFGYVIDQVKLMYKTTFFDEKCEPINEVERGPINDTTEFCRRMLRIIRYGLEDGQR